MSSRPTPRDGNALFALSAFAVLALLLALHHVTRPQYAVLWDDALFFKRVAYNIIHHGFAGWNQADGPAFVGSSQLFQVVATLLLALFPAHYSSAVTLWSALALCASFVVLWRATRPVAAGPLFLFCALQAPPLLLLVTTGMETPTVILVMAFVLHALLCSELSEPRPAWLVALQVLVYLVRPDAILLSLPATFGALFVQGRTRLALQVAGAALASIGLVSLCFYGYYGTPVPLSTFVKISPFSAYDSQYLSLGWGNKLLNGAQFSLLLLALTPAIACRLDRLNLVLSGAGLLFVSYHALTTYEIAAYHARFYAPSLPFFAVAALRGLERADTRRAQLALLACGAAVMGLWWHAYSQAWIESSLGYGPDIVTRLEYLPFFLAVPLVAAVRLCVPAPHARWVIMGAVAVLTLARAREVLPRSGRIVTDKYSELKTARADRAFRGIEIIRRCFEEPFKVTHSEIGIPGVFFLESQVIDFTGLANRAVADRSFDFEKLCLEGRPEFIYQPHRTHERLNRLIKQSPCLAANYTRASLGKPSSAPLHVRNDLWPEFQRCGRLEKPRASAAGSGR